MRRYLLITAIIFSLSVFSYGQRGAEIGTYPPQIHQQICQESTFTRYLDVFNTGDSDLVFTAMISPDTLSWISAAPMSGKILPDDTAKIEFNFNSTGLPLNNYYANFIISSNDTADPEHIVLCMLHVQVLNILLNPESDSICLGCSTKLNLAVFGCSEAYLFNWTSDPPGFNSTEKSPVVSPLINTTYTVTVTDGSYSDQKSVYIQVYGSSGVMENNDVREISVYPVPGNDRVTVKYNSKTGAQGMLTVMDLSGRMLISRIIDQVKGLNEVPVDTGNLSPGVYILTVETGKNSIQPGILNTRIMVQ